MVYVQISLGRGGGGCPFWLGVGLDPHLSFAFAFFFFFFPLLHAFQREQNSLFMYYLTLFTHCFGTVHGTHSHFIQKKILKMGPTVLFTHLKIILLQCFQFSAK